MTNHIPPAFTMKATEIYKTLLPALPIWWLNFSKIFDEAKYNYNKLSELKEQKTINAHQLFNSFSQKLVKNNVKCK